MEYTLKKGGATASVHSFGGEMTAFTVGDTLYTWTGDAKYWSGRAPVLFPNVCSLKDGTVTIGGKPYQIEKHGFGRRNEFEVAGRGDDFIVFELRHNAETLAMYPFEFSLKIAHTVFDGGFQTEYTVKNSGSGEMAFCLGGHPAFRVPLFEGESFSDYSLVFEQEELPYACITENGLMKKGLVKNLKMQDGRILPLNYADFDGDALIFTDVRSKKVSVLKNGRGFAFSYPGFPVLGVWTPPHKNAPFLCLEPWYGLPAYTDEDGSFENKPYAVKLQPGAEFSAAYSMRTVG